MNKQLFDKFAHEATYNPVLWAVNYDYDQALSLRTLPTQIDGSTVVLSVYCNAGPMADRELSIQRTVDGVTTHGIHIKGDNVRTPMHTAVHVHGLTFINTLAKLGRITRFCDS